LKPKTVSVRCLKDEVAPRAGAWIETIYKNFNWFTYVVAPRAGAWIETATGRGIDLDIEVAPRAGAWIETVRFSMGVRIGMSPPVRGRGLKRAGCCLFAVGG